MRLDPRQNREIPLSDLRALIGLETGVSDWHRIDQAQIDAFADLCGDHQAIHVDPDVAAATPFGGTIAHGFHTLALLTWLSAGPRPRIAGVSHSVNYGFDRIRFVAPVPSGARIRARFRLAALDETADEAAVTTHWDVTVEIEGKDRPALAARWLNRAFLQ